MIAALMAVQTSASYHAQSTMYTGHGLFFNSSCLQNTVYQNKVALSAHNRVDVSDELSVKISAKAVDLSQCGNSTVCAVDVYLDELFDPFHIGE